MQNKYRENGAFYITKKKCLIKTHNRISGKIKAIEMNELYSLDIDEEKDFNLVEKIILNIKKDHHINIEKDHHINIEKLKKIRLVITDIDGVMTDGGMYYSEKGEFLKKFNTRDAKGLELIRKAGIKVAFMTGENSPIVTSRAKKLGIQTCYLGVEEKKSMLFDVCNEMNLSFENIAFIGDDVNDLECMKAVGFSAAPSDAVGDILKIADYVTTAPGGNGAVREVCNLILEYCGAVKNIS
jgi:N-acylneuraminate cytidylyltransferase